MSEPSKTISLKNLALRLCGEPADGNIASEEVDSILGYLESAVFGKDLKTWYADKPFPPYESELEGIYGFKKYGERFNWEPYKEIKNGELEWEQFIGKYSHKILIQQGDFENYLKNALLKNIDAVQEWNIEFAKQGYNNAIEEEKFLTHLKDLYGKNQPWNDKAAGKTTGKPKEATPRQRVKNKIMSIIRKHLKKNRQAKYADMYGEIIKAKNPALKDNRGRVFPVQHTCENWISIEGKTLNNL